MRKIVLYFLLIVTACVGEISNNNEQDEAQTVNIWGVAQKGQLVKGSQVTAYALNNNLYSSGQSYPAAISDDLGSFRISATTGGKYLELRAEGYYFVENTGSIADSPIYLQSIIESKEKNANINILTTLIVPRIKYLVSTGVSFSEAKNRAQNEIINALTKGAYSSITTEFDNMDISKDSEANAVLLALSCLFQEGRNTGDALVLMSDISSDFEKTGTVSNELIEQLYLNNNSINVLSIINNLKVFYNKKGFTDYSIPAFYKYIGNIASDAFVVLNPLDFNTNEDNGVLYLRGVSNEGVSVKLYFLFPSTVQIQQVDELGRTHTYSWISSSIEPYETIAWVASFDIKANPDLRRRAYINIVDTDGTVLQSLYFDQDVNTEKVTTTALETRSATEVEASSAVLNASLDLSNVQYDSISYGFYWGNSENALNTELSGGDIKDNAYSASLSNLSHKTQYWYKSYVTLDGQTFYGEVKSFTTDVVPVDSVLLDKTKHTFNTIGNTLTLIATVLPTDATDNSVVWSSDTESVATVDQNGTVKAVGNGTAIITVAANDGSGVKATCEVEVKQYVTSITLSDTSLSLYVGAEKNISVTSILPDNANDKTCAWSSSNASVAAVDQNGKITAKSNGNTEIRATANDESKIYATCAVQVYKVPDAVDLGIIVNGKAIKWSSANLGAASSEDYGDFYAWGETESKVDYSWSTYKFGTSYLGPFSKYNTSSSYGVVDNKTVLEKEDDVAYIKLGGNWRMPTHDEWTELREQCTWTRTTQNGVIGSLVTSKTNGNSIFLPAAGHWSTGTPFPLFVGNRCWYWSSSLLTDEPYRAWSVYFGPDGFEWANFDRGSGLSVRPVTE